MARDEIRVGDVVAEQGHGRRSWVLVVAAGCAVVLLSACPPTRHPTGEPGAPGTKEAAGPSPSEILKRYQAHAPPPLASAAQVPAFLDWAGASHTDEQEDGRKVIAAAAGDQEVVQTLIAEIERVQTADHPRALLALAVLGETRSPLAQRFFTEFARRPLPKEGTVIEGEIMEQTRAAQLQGKAVDGLAFINDASANKAVMEIIANHPSGIVRAEAINAYLWNHGDSAEARRALSQVVRRDEAILLDRVRRVTGETADTFNAKLDAFLKQHPEVIPPRPEPLKAPPRPGVQGQRFDAKPPAF
jgi:hypothetical protein